MYNANRQMSVNADHQSDEDDVDLEQDQHQDQIQPNDEDNPNPEQPQPEQPAPAQPRQPQVPRPDAASEEPSPILNQMMLAYGSMGDTMSNFVQSQNYSKFALKFDGDNRQILPFLIEFDRWVKINHIDNNEQLKFRTFFIALSPFEGVPSAIQHALLPDRIEED